MSRVFIPLIALAFIYSFTGTRKLTHQDLELLLSHSDTTGIDKAGFDFWKKEDGFIGYQSNNYDLQLWLKPDEEIHISSEQPIIIGGGNPKSIRYESFSDGPMSVMFVYPVLVAKD